MKIGITGTGSYIPSLVIANQDFETAEFLNSDGSPFKQDNPLIIEKFKAITGIVERRYVEDDLNTSDIAFLAAEKAIADAAIDKEQLDYIIFAHNFGDVSHGQCQGDT
ncbi:MAG TPA: ketoacyl-ACP synthase III, partial [Pricia sp.]|nr:ketoacyl-ACP synthase III [Pricia sp.]